MLETHGAHVLSSDVIARELMARGTEVYRRIVDLFGEEVVLAGGDLNRPALANLAFGGGRVEELNRIVHPAVMARQQELMDEVAADRPEVVVVVESALIFETRYSPDSGSEGSPERWRNRFDTIVLVTAGEELKVARFVERSAKLLGEETELTAEIRIQLQEEARRRLALQASDEIKSAYCDYVVANDGGLAELQWQIDRLWPLLQAKARLRNQGVAL